MNVSPNEQLLALTREMLAFAEASDWDKLVELEKTRLPLFHQVFAEGVSGNVELAQEVLLIDEKTKSLAEAGMPVLQREILMIRNSGEANNAYQAIQGLKSAGD